MKNIIFVILLFFVCFDARAEDNVYVDIKKGEKAAFDGKLFTNAAIAKIISDNKLKLSECQINSEISLKRQKLELETKYDLLEKKYKLDVEMYDAMLENRNKLISSGDYVIKNKNYENWKFVGSFILGSTITVGIVYSLDKLRQ